MRTARACRFRPSAQREKNSMPLVFASRLRLCAQKAKNSMPLAFASRSRLFVLRAKRLRRTAPALRSRAWPARFATMLASASQPLRRSTSGAAMTRSDTRSLRLSTARSRTSSLRMFRLPTHAPTLTRQLPYPSVEIYAEPPQWSAPQERFSMMTGRVASQNLR